MLTRTIHRVPWAKNHVGTANRDGCASTRAVVDITVLGY